MVENLRNLINQHYEAAQAKQARLQEEAKAAGAKATDGMVMSD
jgi:hypothetical protein